MHGGMDVIGEDSRESGIPKIRDKAMSLAALGVSYEPSRQAPGFAKSTLCKWMNQEEYKRPKLSGEVLELDMSMGAGRGR